jgi:hypothetical protein
MNIIELAKQAGLRAYQEQAPGIDGVFGNWEDLETFAELVAAHERKFIAEQWEKWYGYDKHGVAEFIRKRANTQEEQT